MAEVQSNWAQFLVLQSKGSARFQTKSMKIFVIAILAVYGMPTSFDVYDSADEVESIKEQIGNLEKSL